MPIGQLRILIQVLARHHQVPGHHRGLGPQQLPELILNVLVELVDGGIRRDLQNILAVTPLAIGPADERGAATLTRVETAPSLFAAILGTLVPEATRGAEPALVTVGVGGTVVPGEATGRTLIARDEATTLVVAAGAGPVAIAAARVTVATGVAVTAGTTAREATTAVPVTAAGIAIAERTRARPIAIATPRVTGAGAIAIATTGVSAAAGVGAASRTTVGETTPRVRTPAIARAEAPTRRVTTTTAGVPIAVAAPRITATTTARVPVAITATRIRTITRAEATA